MQCAKGSLLDIPSRRPWPANLRRLLYVYKCTAVEKSITSPEAGELWTICCTAGKRSWDDRPVKTESSCQFELVKTRGRGLVLHSNVNLYSLVTASSVHATIWT
jgi:hypothetical protein